MIELRCKDCRQVFLIEKYHDISLVKGAPQYCPFCASTNVFCSKVDRYWHDLSESLGFGRTQSGADLIHGLYKEWNPHEYRRFRDFVMTVKEQFAEEGV